MRIPLVLYELTKFPCDASYVMDILQRDHIIEGILGTLKEIYPQWAHAPEKKEHFVINALSVLCFLEREEVFPYILDMLRHPEGLSPQGIQKMLQTLPHWIRLLSAGGQYQNNFWYSYRIILPLGAGQKELFRGAVLSQMKKLNRYGHFLSVPLALEFKEVMFPLERGELVPLATVALDDSFLGAIQDFVCFSRDSLREEDREAMFSWLVLRAVKNKATLPGSLLDLWRDYYQLVTMTSLEETLERPGIAIFSHLQEKHPQAMVMVDHAYQEHFGRQSERNHGIVLPLC